MLSWQGTRAGDAGLVRGNFLSAYGSRSMSDVSQILERAGTGDHRAFNELFALVYDELRRMAAAQLAQERPGNSLQATVLVHEAYLRLIDHACPGGPPTADHGAAQRGFRNRRYFFGAAARAMRRILIDQARRKKRVKHGGDLVRIELLDQGAVPTDDELVALDTALLRLAEEDPVAAEVVELKFFAGMSRSAIAEMMELSIHEIRTKWAYARAWLQVAMEQ